MTIITLFRDAQGQLIGFDCRGHAGYACSGSDIVCAAISVLCTTCVNALESVAGVRPQVRVSDGAMHVLLKKEQQTHDALVILKTLEQGISDIALSYPKYIRTEEQHHVET